MRKTLMALILVLPMVFVLVIFSSVNLVSLGVKIAVNGIKILAEGADADGTLFLDMADKTDRFVTAEVSPGNATEKGYKLTSSAPELVEVTKDGKIVPKAEGTAEITATSNDKSFTDTMSVVVVSSKPYDFDFTLFCEAGEEDLLTETEEGYEATLPTGTYTYGMNIHPMEYTEFSISQEREAGDAVPTEIEPGARTIFLPFTGDAVFGVTVPGGVDGPIRKTVRLHVVRPTLTEPDGTKREAVAVINGAAVYEREDGAVSYEEGGGSMQLAHGTQRVQLYVECAGGKPTVSVTSGKALASVSGVNGRYTLDVSFGKDADGAALEIRAYGKTIPFLFTFTDFAFNVFSDRTITDGQVTLLTGNAVTFYAVASGGAKDVVYSWNFEGPAESIRVNGDTATVKADEGDYSLTVTAEYGEKVIHRTILISVIKKISVVQIANNVNAGLAECYTVAGKAYAKDLTLTDNTYPLLVYTYSTSGMELAGGAITYSVTDPVTGDPSDLAEVLTDEHGASPVLVPKGTGKVTVKAAWTGNDAFKATVRASLTLYLVHDAVAVKNAPELTKAMEENRAAVLTADIKLGTDASGKDFSVEQRTQILSAHRIKSTYNTEWYKHTADRVSPELSYVLEFTNDVYGNGKSVDADNFTHAIGGTGTPLLSLYRGPLYFVKYKDVASVAGQDNCAFLVRTDGVRLYGVNLLGCSDESLLSEKGEYDLTNLNLTGTTLEINASCEIVNCRIRNGRNVVRAYGGNRSGDKYFIDDLSQNAAGAEKERIDVKIEGCILSQGREFLLKMGANRALRASKINGQEPPLRDQSGKAYPETDRSNRYGDLYKDAWFYKQYVMTDVTLKDCVLETSGLFTVGLESNFSGEFLYEGATDHQWRNFTREWEYSGGTSFASVLRLEGDVRLYDWKDLALIDSSTLIESPVGALSEWLKLDIKGMLDFVSSQNAAAYGDIIEATSDGKQYVHGGIALYGGGRNYSAVDLSGLNADLKDGLLFLNVNINVLKDGPGTMQQQGSILPRAAGTHDFNFYMYGKKSANDFVKQKNDEQLGLKYKGVKPVSAF